jgi:SAM-dependent methyltransferase
VSDYGPETYGERWADAYDDLTPRFASATDAERAADVLARLAGEGRALELAIGTGRIALPLAARGVEVTGIDASEAMIERLRGKPGADRIAVTVGDFADVAVDGPFRLVFSSSTRSSRCSRRTTRCVASPTSRPASTTTASS